MRAVDTNVLVRLITRDDARQVDAAEAFIESGAWISLLALVEATWVLSSVYERDRRAVAAAVEMLQHHRTLTVQDADTVAAALQHYQQRPRVAFSDCLMLEVARKAGHAPLGTFDRDLGRIAGAVRL
jgi:predicted nucleic-acid-binding protein